MPINRKWALKLRRRDAKYIAQDALQPITLHRWALVGATTDYGPASYSWAGSWATRLDTLGRETWAVETTEAATASKRSMVLIVPYDPDTQTWDPYQIGTTDRLIMIDEGTGEEYAEFKVNLILKTASKVEINVELIQ